MAQTIVKTENPEEGTVQAAENILRNFEANLELAVDVTAGGSTPSPGLG